MSIPRDNQVVLNAWMALAGLAPSHAYLNGHSAIARVPDSLASWTATVNGFVNANYAGPDGTARLVDAVITNLGLSAVVGIREVAMEFFNSQPQNRGGSCSPLNFGYNLAAQNKPLILLQERLRAAATLG